MSLCCGTSTHLTLTKALALEFRIVPVNDLEEASRWTADPYEIRVLPAEFFSPKYYWTGKVEITQNTVCIHHFFGSRLPRYLKTEALICKYLGIKNFKIIERVSWKLRALKLKIFK